MGHGDRLVVSYQILHETAYLSLCFNPVIEMMSIDSLIEVVGQNLAVTIIPKSYVENIHDSRVQAISIINPILKKDVGIVYRKDRFMSAATKAFIQQLKIVIQTSTD